MTYNIVIVVIGTIIGVLVSELPILAYLVLKINPRKGAELTKKALLNDDQFFDLILDKLVSDQKLPKYEPILEKLRLKLQGTIMGSAQVEKLKDKMLDSMISDGVQASDPQIGIAIDLVKQFSPKYGKFLDKHPELALQTVSKLRSRGILPQGESENINGFDPYR